MKILISAFDPFGEDKINASQEILKFLPDQVGGVEIIKVLLPTQIKKSYEVLLAAIEAYNVDVVINIGQAKGRDKITFERVAINLLDFSIADNGGNQYCEEEIQTEGENAYFTNLDLKSLLENVNKEGYDCVISNTAGTYVCNYIMYTMQYLIHTRYPLLKECFIHVPCLPQQGDAKIPSMELSTMVDALLCFIKMVIKQENQKEKVLVSSCLLGIQCRYDGSNTIDPEVCAYLKDKRVYPVCPEVLGGLEVPRIACEIKAGRVINKIQEDKTDAFINGANEVLNLAKKEGIQKAILKSRSPSCGYEKIYDGTFSKKILEGNGICTQLLLDNGLNVISSDDKRFKK